MLRTPRPCRVATARRLRRIRAALLYFVDATRFASFTSPIQRNHLHLIVGREQGGLAPRHAALRDSCGTRTQREFKREGKGYQAK
jgi:hypothetical protein